MRQQYRRILGGLALLVFLSPTMEARANSAPVFWRGNPASAVLTLDQESGIHVVSEKLTFDFQEEVFYFAPRAVVTAEYGFRIDGSESRTSTMAFPIVTSLDRFLPEEVKISQDEKALPYRIRLGGSDHLTETSPRSDYGIDYEGLFSSIKDQATPSFLSERLGTRHVIRVEPGQKGFLSVELQGSPGELGYFSGFHSYERREDVDTILGGIFEGAVTFDVFTTKEDLSFSVQAYTDYEKKTVLEDFRYEWTQESTNAGAYILERMNTIKGTVMPILQEIEEEELLRVIEDQARRQETAGYFSDIDQATEIFFYDQVVVLLYDVTLDPDTEHGVTVSYLTEGTFDRTETKDPVYRYTYLLQPARYFESFKDLSVTVHTPENVPYIPKSTPSLMEAGPRLYQGTFAALPEGEELQFVLHQEPTIAALTVWDRIFSGYTIFFVGIFFVLPVLAIMAVVGLFYVVLNRRQRT